MDFEVFERTSKTKRNQFDPQCLKITQNVPFEFLIFWHFSPIFVLLKLTCLVTLLERNIPKLAHPK